MRTCRSLVGVALAGVLAACSSGTGGGDGVDNGLPGAASKSTPAAEVVAAENVWGDIARQIAGSALTVTSIISRPDQDPHEYESTLGDAALVAHARLVIRNGAGYDTFADKLLTAASGSGRSVLTVADVVGVHGSGANPHLWYRPSYVAATAHAIADAMGRIVPGQVPVLQRNLATFLAGEDKVQQVVAHIRAAHAGDYIAYTEPVAAYLTQDAGLRLGIPASYARAIEEGTDPSPLDDAAFKAALAGHKVRVLLYNGQVTDAATADAKRTAEKNGVPVVAVTETLPPALPDFQSWQLAQARALQAALGG
jgi:zinc/manganese transport system substrate-binding protein